MKLRLISIFLLFLFSVVIAFPGYSKPRVCEIGVNTPVLTTTPDSTPGKVLLLCLSSGINMVEEERTSEHQDDDTSPDEVFVPSYMLTAILATFTFSSFTEHALFIEQHQHSDIFFPPEFIA